MKLEDAERSLAILTRLATNAECINPIMEGITSFILGLLSLADPNHDAFLDKAITELFNQIIKVRLDRGFRSNGGPCRSSAMLGIFSG